MRIKSTILPCAVIALLGLSTTAQKNADMSAARQLSNFGAVVKELETNYVDTIDHERAFTEAVNALLATVDPYTVYFPKEDREDITQMTTGEYGGIGAYLLQRDSASYISEPMAGSPALAAGLRAGDRLMKVDTTDVSHFTTDKVTKLLRGKPDSQVSVVVKRPYVTDSIIRVNITRTKMRQPSVPYHGVVDGIGYIRLSQFIEKTGEDVRKALEEFKCDPQVKGIVIDLRGNGGGLLEQAVDVASNFLPKGTEVVRTRGRDKSDEKIYKTHRSPLMPDMPLAILVDGATASASEILAGAIQDLHRGTLVGSKTFGKGLVQTTRPLPYGGVLKVTVARYYTPAGRMIQAIDYTHRKEDGTATRLSDGGLTPDTVVEWNKVNRLVYKLVSDNHIFDFANRYAAEHPVIADAAEFTVTDSIYSDFKASIDPKTFNYDSEMEEATKSLRKIAGDEGYLNPETTAAFDTLQKLLTLNLDRDLDTHRRQITEYLGSEIVSRYQYERGRTRYALRDDPAFDTAAAIIKKAATKKK